MDPYRALTVQTIIECDPKPQYLALHYRCSICSSLLFANVKIDHISKMIYFITKVIPPPTNVSAEFIQNTVKSLKQLGYTRKDPGQPFILRQYEYINEEIFLQPSYGKCVGLRFSVVTNDSTKYINNFPPFDITKGIEEIKMNDYGQWKLI